MLVQVVSKSARADSRGPKQLRRTQRVCGDDFEFCLDLLLSAAGKVLDQCAHHSLSIQQEPAAQGLRTQRQSYLAKLRAAVVHPVRPSAEDRVGARPIEVARGQARAGE